jgi:hypothetical protein
MHRICDRCKKEEIISDVKKNYLTASEPKYVPYEFPKYMISTTDEHYMYKEINLCKDCEKEFEAFLTEFDIPKE